MKKVVGVFNNRQQAIDAINDLKARGYDMNQISLVAKDDQTTQDIQAHTDAGVNDAVAENAGAGAVTGGILGGLGGLLLGMGAFAIPGVGPIVAAGPLAAAIGGAATGGMAGGLIGALTGMGVDETEARTYESNFNSGDILVIADTDEQNDYVYESFSKNRALNTQYYPEKYRRV